MAENFVILFLKNAITTKLWEACFQNTWAEVKAKKNGIENMATKMTPPKLLHKPDSIGDMDLKY